MEATKTLLTPMCAGCASYVFSRTSSNPHGCKQNITKYLLRRDGMCGYRK